MSDDGPPGVAMVVAMLIGVAFTIGLCARALLWLLSTVMVIWHVLVQC